VKICKTLKRVLFRMRVLFARSFIREIMFKHNSHDHPEATPQIAGGREFEVEPPPQQEACIEPELTAHQIPKVSDPVHT